MSQLQFLGAGGGMLVAFAVFFLLVEIVKGGKVLWEFLAPKVLGIKTELSRKKELEDLTIKNSEQLEKIIKNNEKTIDETLERINIISSDVKTLTSDVDERFSKIDVNMSTLSNTVQDMQLENMRNIILSFGSDVNNKVYPKEQYEYVKKIYRLYHEIIKETGKTNDEIEITYNKIIMPAYERHIQKHDFLEYMLDNQKVNAAIENDISNATAPKKPVRRRRKPKTEDSDSSTT